MRYYQLMELRRGRNCGREGLLKMVAALFCIFLCLPSVCSMVVDFSRGKNYLGVQTPPGSRRRTLTTTVDDSSIEGNGQDGNRNTGVWAANRYLGGPGSYPPRCTAKCGSCTPCRAVHVPVPPGTPVTTEYYPEAWRCKCGNRLYMP